MKNETFAYFGELKYRQQYVDVKADFNGDLTHFWIFVNMN